MTGAIMLIQRFLRRRIAKKREEERLHALWEAKMNLGFASDQAKELEQYMRVYALGKYYAGYIDKIVLIQKTFI